MAVRSNLKLWVVPGGQGSADAKSSPGPDESVGLFLRLLRERDGLSLADAAERVRIREAYVAAIEDDRFDALPGRAYAIGFVRAYAEALGADVEATARAASREIARLPEPKLQVRKPEADRESRIAPFAAATICLALAGYVYWYFDNSRDRFESAVETLARVDAPNFIETARNGERQPAPYRPFPDAQAPQTQTASAPSPSPGLVSDVPAPPLTAPSSTTPSTEPVANTPSADAVGLARNDGMEERATPPTLPTLDPTPVAGPDVAPSFGAADAPSQPQTPTFDGRQAAAALPPLQALAADLPDPRLIRPAPPQVRSIPSPGPAMAAAPDLTRISPAQAHAAAPDTELAPTPASEVTLFALADTWIEIKSKSTGKVMFSRVLRQGESVPAPDRHGLVMTVGNAGGLEIRIDGAAAPALGDHGQVVREIDLDAAALATRAE